MLALDNIGMTLGNGIQNIANYSAQAAARANAESRTAQSAQGAFNQASVDLSNSIADQRIIEQYAYNAAQAAAANEFSEYMWNKSADWNEAMWEKQANYNREMQNIAQAWNEQMWDKSASWNEAMWNKQAEFNSAEAEKNRQWQMEMMSTAYQRATEDMKKAGLNPILAATHGINPSIGSGSVASVGGTSMGNPTMGASSIGGTSMSSAQGAMASGGILNGNSANESSYTGQMEYMSGTLGLISAITNGISSAMKGLGSLGDIGKGLGESLGKMIEYSGEKAKEYTQKATDDIKNRLTPKYNPGNWGPFN